MEQQPPPPAMTTKPHFLVTTFPAQGHLNPALDLAKRLASSTTGDVTFYTSTTGHRKMFPFSSPTSQIRHNGITYIPFPDGSSASSSSHLPSDPNMRSFLTESEQLGSKHLTSLLKGFAASSRPVTCVIYTMMLQWASDVARGQGIPTALYWIQAGTVLSIYHHFFNDKGYESLVVAHAKDPSFTVAFPSLPLFQIRDLPTFFTITSPEEPFYDILVSFRKLFHDLYLRKQTERKPRVLVNSFDELEMNALASMEEHMELITLGPVVQDASERETGDMFEEDDKKYMEWLDSQKDKSVVYVSFGSVHKISKEDVEEIRKGLVESQRPYLWVVRKDSRREDVSFDGEEKQGMVVEWCKQVKVLRHKAVGCFVTHCGWNSTLEGLFSGVPAVAMPTWSDQFTNAFLMEREWGTAVKAEAGENGRVGAEELARCLEIVMGEGERGVKIRMRAEMWKEEARKAVGEGGSSGKNLKAFAC